MAGSIAEVDHICACVRATVHWTESSSVMLVPQPGLCRRALLPAFVLLDLDCSPLLLPLLGLRAKKSPIQGVGV